MIINLIIGENVMDDLLKEAIADAKAVRETALENAKIALEEAFTPRLQSMLSKKIQSEVEVDEQEDEDEEEEAAEEGYGNMNDDDEDPSDDHSEEEMEEDEESEDEESEEMEEDDEESEEEMDEDKIIEIDGVKYAPVVAEEDGEEEAEEEADDEMEESDDLDLEAVLRELEEEEDDEDDEMEEAVYETIKKNDPVFSDDDEHLFDTKHLTKRILKSLIYWMTPEEDLNDAQKYFPFCTQAELAAYRKQLRQHLTKTDTVSMMEE